MDGLAEVAREAGVPFTVDSVGGIFDIYFREGVPTSSTKVTKSDVGRSNTLFHAMLSQGVYLAPSVSKVGFMPAAHGDAILDVTFEAARRAFEGI